MLTGKGLTWGGARVRKEATGLGCAYFTAEMLVSDGSSLEGLDVVVSGSGNVAIYAIEKIHALGGRLRPRQPPRRRARFVEARAVREVPCRVALPRATQNELPAKEAGKLIGNGVRAVAEGGNMPCTPEAIRAFRLADVLFAPRARRLTPAAWRPALEMQQNASRDSWTFEYSEQRLREIVREPHHSISETAERFGLHGDYVAGANITGFARVADAMLANGLI